MASLNNYSPASSDASRCNKTNNSCNVNLHDPYRLDQIFNKSGVRSKPPAAYRSKSCLSNSVLKRQCDTASESMKRFKNDQIVRQRDTASETIKIKSFKNDQIASHFRREFNVIQDNMRSYKPLAMQDWNQTQFEISEVKDISIEESREVLPRLISDTNDSFTIYSCDSQDKSSADSPLIVVDAEDEASIDSVITNVEGDGRNGSDCVAVTPDLFDKRNKLVPNESLACHSLAHFDIENISNQFDKSHRLANFEIEENISNQFEASLLEVADNGRGEKTLTIKDWFLKMQKTPQKNHTRQNASRLQTPESENKRIKK